LIGAVSETDLPRWMNACNVFAMPNREINGDNEGFGMVFIEAAACGKPSLAGKAGGAPSAVLDQATGILVNGNDVNDLAQSLKRLIVDKELSDRLGTAGYKRVQAEFTWDYVALTTNKLFWR
jgi:phosphatidylinositol alpha-1,6-mannosyltransferase